MKNMTLILIVLILFGGIIMLNGCYSIPIIDQPRVTPSSSTEYISVESTPSDAEIYINNMLVGRTPSKGLPITVHYTIDKDWISRWADVREQYVLRVSKEGYKDEAEPLAFKSSENGLGVFLIKSEFHFVLEPRVIGQSHNEPASDSSVVVDSASSTTVTHHDLQLEGIIYGKESPSAIINGKAMKIGDKINGILLIDIKSDRVILYDGKGNFELQAE